MRMSARCRSPRPAIRWRDEADGKRNGDSDRIRHLATLVRKCGIYGGKAVGGWQGDWQMTDPADNAAMLVASLRALLSDREAGAPCFTYQGLAKALGLAPPGTIQRIAAALEQTMREDVDAGRPMVAALVVSRTDGLPRRGFFDLAVELGRFPSDPERHRAAWQAERAAVLGQVGGDEAGCARTPAGPARSGP